MTSRDIRKSFIKFFQSKGHEIVPSDSLVPVGDPSLLFTGAGMNQFKDKFLGKNVSYKRAVSCQKCLRTGDLEKVGKTRGHHTFFEMLGNFSFGDYFKEDAIKFAWEFLTEVLKLDKENLWVTVYENDPESYEIWKNLIGLPESKIQKKGMDENFWPANAPIDGPNGPCGPCSEIYFNDLEVWNLVFTQFNRTGPNILENLVNKNIDTGMGLERITQVMQNAATNFETDLFSDIVKKIQNSSQIDFDNIAISHRNAIADHIRSVVFAIQDGVMPSNEERGYVIRKLIRRSMVHMAYLGIKDSFLYKLVDTVARAMKEPYPDLEKSRDMIAQIVKKEEEQFLTIFNEKIPIVRDTFLKIKNETSEPDALEKSLVETSFEFYDTHGVPFDMLEDCAKNLGLSIAEAGFNKKLDEQRERSRSSGKISTDIFSTNLEDKIADLGFKTEFVGYKTASQDAKILALVDLTTSALIESAKKNAEVGIILDRTPFYGESGGQVGDTGVFEFEGKKIKIIDTKKFKDTIVHIAKYDSLIKKNLRVIASIDEKRRENIMRNHTATHLLQSVLRETLGDNIRQAGSIVDDKHLRFDFQHQNKIDDIELENISKKINGMVFEGEKITVKDNVKLIDAKKDGAIAIFGEKYGDAVRVISIGNFSKELCGGTHLANIKDIGFLKIISESSIASGVRRIEALTGKIAKDYVIENFRKILSELKNRIQQINSREDNLKLKKTEFAIVNKFNNIALERLGFKDMYKLEAATLELKSALSDAMDIEKNLDKKIHAAKLTSAKSEVDKFLTRAKLIGQVSIIVERIDNSEINILRSIADEIKSKLKSSYAILLGGKHKENLVYTLNLSDDLVKKGLNAAIIIKSVSAIAEGSGGGRPDFAQAGGKNHEKLDLSLSEALKIFEKELIK